jgi:hypothetical protein
MARRPSSRSIGNIILVVLLGGVLVTQALQAVATHQPADKVSAASSNVDEIEGTTPILKETMRVSSVSDSILQLTSECALFTRIVTGNEDQVPAPPGQDTNTSTATTQIELRITIDGEPVPVSTYDTDPDVEGVQTDDGWVVFCNRVYSRTMTDADGNGDIDDEDSYINTRTANAFNWFALDVGKEYDKPDVPAGSGNNIVEVVVEARYVSDVVGEGSAEAHVGKRSLIVEPTHADVHEQVTPGID